MFVLLVEDDGFKSTQITSFLKSHRNDVNVDLVKSLNAGLRALEENIFDVVLLDMSLPTYTQTSEESGGRPQPFGGKEVLLFMERREINTPVIVVTQYQTLGKGQNAVDLNTLEAQLQDEFGPLVRAIIHFDDTTGEWQNKLEGKLFEVMSLMTKV